MRRISQQKLIKTEMFCIRMYYIVLSPCSLFVQETELQRTLYNLHVYICNLHLLKTITRVKTNFVRIEKWILTKKPTCHAPSVPTPPLVLASPLSPSPSFCPPFVALGLSPYSTSSWKSSPSSSNREQGQHRRTGGQGRMGWASAASSLAMPASAQTSCTKYPVGGR